MFLWIFFFSFFFGFARHSKSEKRCIQNLVIWFGPDSATSHPNHGEKNCAFDSLTSQPWLVRKSQSTFNTLDAFKLILCLKPKRDTQAGMNSWLRGVYYRSEPRECCHSDLRGFGIICRQKFWSSSYSRPLLDHVLLAPIEQKWMDFLFFLPLSYYTSSIVPSQQLVQKIHLGGSFFRKDTGKLTTTRLEGFGSNF